MTPRWFDYRHFACLSLAICLFMKAPALQGGQIATFELTPKPGNSGLTIFQADVQPAFSVVPSDPSASPLKVLDGSSGFNQDNLTVLLGNGDGVQQLVMLFGVAPSRDAEGKITGFQPVLDSTGNPDPGLAGNGVVKFSLDLDPNFKGSLNLLPTPTSSQTFNLTTLSLPVTSPSSPETTPVTTPTTAPTPVPTTQVPEPVSIAMWFACMGFGTLRAMQFRRQRKAQLA
ncbi:MAG: hypothetical protein ACKO0V_23210 [bacterium]